MGKVAFNCLYRSFKLCSFIDMNDAQNAQCIWVGEATKCILPHTTGMLHNVF